MAGSLHAANDHLLRKLPGWKQDISGIRNYDELPEAARSYVQTIGQLLNSPVKIVSVGPDREQTILRS